jgi:hypothetical protein
MDVQEREAFAKEWLNGWNERDLERIIRVLDVAGGGHAGGTFDRNAREIEEGVAVSPPHAGFEIDRRVLDEPERLLVRPVARRNSSGVSRRGSSGPDNLTTTMSTNRGGEVHQRVELLQMEALIFLPQSLELMSLATRSVAKGWFIGGPASNRHARYRTAESCQLVQPPQLLLFELRFCSSALIPFFSSSPDYRAPAWSQ